MQLLGECIILNKNIINKIYYIIFLSIIYPESLRYSDVSDLFETKILEKIYVKYGSEKSNFSIGLCQMKPSFIEELEIAQNVFKIKAYDFVQFPWWYTPRQKRKERINRLKEEQWQVIYGVLFVKVVERKFSNLRFPSDSEKVAFYAAAYNLGFNKSVIQIKSHINKKSFPVIDFPNKTHYSYAHLAKIYYEENCDRLFKELSKNNQYIDIKELLSK